MWANLCVQTLHVGFLDTIQSLNDIANQLRLLRIVIKQTEFDDLRHGGHANWIPQLRLEERVHHRARLACGRHHLGLERLATSEGQLEEGIGTCRASERNNEDQRRGIPAFLTAANPTPTAPSMIGRPSAL